jgi:hypothetical protein
MGPIKHNLFYLKEELVKKLSALSVDSSPSPIGIALATEVGAEVITAYVVKSLAGAGIKNVSVTYVGNPVLLPYVASKLSANHSVVLAIATITSETAYLNHVLTEQLLEIGIKGNNPIIPGVISASSLLELKALLAVNAPIWTKSVASLLALKSSSAVAVADIVSDKLLVVAEAAPEQPTAETTSTDVLLASFRESLKVVFISTETFFLYSVMQYLCIFSLGIQLVNIL